MKIRTFTWTICAMAVLVSAAGGLAQTADRDGPTSPRRHFSGLLNDYTPSAAVVGGGPYEMRGKWSLDVDEIRGLADFAAALNMETSDYGIVQGTVNKDDPTTRGAHTHHISMTNAIVTSDWATACPTFKPPVSGGFVVTGSAFVTGNGGPAPFGNPSPLTVCVLGAANVTFSNATLTLGSPASKHFGSQAIHGVVTGCSDRAGHDCTVQE